MSAAHQPQLPEEGAASPASRRGCARLGGMLLAAINVSNTLNRPETKGWALQAEELLSPALSMHVLAAALAYVTPPSPRV